MLPAQPNKSLINGITCLQALVSHEGPVGCKQLAVELGLSITQVNRLLKTLAHMGFVQQSAGVKYEAGPGVHIMAAQSLYGSGLLKAALEPLNELAAMHVTVALGVLWQDQVVYFYHRSPGRSAEQAISGHELYPASSSVIGITLLSGFTEEKIRTLYKDKPVSSYKNGIRSLLKELKQTQKRGYTLVLNDTNGHGLGMPVGIPWCGGVALSNIPADKDIQPYLLALKKAVGDINSNLAKRG